VFFLIKKRVFSLYDVEQFLKDAGAERVSERAVISLERELQDTVNGLVNEATFYANYAGRKRLINLSDINLVDQSSKKRHLTYKGKSIRRKKDATELKRSSAMKEIIPSGSVRLKPMQEL
jgi:histone H3/H4